MASSRWIRFGTAALAVVGCAGPAFNGGTGGALSGGAGGAVVASAGRGAATEGGSTGLGGASAGGGSAGSLTSAGVPSGGASGDGGTTNSLAGSANGGAPRGGAASGGATSAGSSGVGAAPSGGRASGGAPAGGSVSGGAPSGGSANVLPVKDGLTLWLDAANVVAQTSGSVCKWPDQSSAKLDATQMVGAWCPTLVHSESDQRALIGFDGNDDRLSLPEGFSDFSAGVSFFAVVEVTVDNKCPSFLQLSNGAELDDLEVGRQQGSLQYEVSASSLAGPDNALELNRRVVIEVVHSDSSVELRLNGQILASSPFDLPAVVTRTQNFIGGTLYADCAPLGARVGELLLFTRALDSTERAAVEKYLAAKWQCCTL